jgi:hypothetical protein
LQFKITENFAPAPGGKKGTFCCIALAAQEETSCSVFAAATAAAAARRREKVLASVFHQNKGCIGCGCQFGHFLNA